MNLSNFFVKFWVNSQNFWYNNVHFLSHFMSGWAMSSKNSELRAKITALTTKLKAKWESLLGARIRALYNRFAKATKLDKLTAKVSQKFGKSKSGRKNVALPILGVFLVGIVLVAIVAGSIGYKIGHGQGLHAASVVAVDEKGEALTTDDIKAIRLQNDILKTETATLTQERDISLNNLNLLKDEMETLKVSYLQLEQLNEVLSKVAIKEGGVPLGMLGAQIVSLPDNAFEYRFDVAMLSRDGRGKTLTPKLTLLNATSMVEIPLKPATYTIQGVANIRGRFIMPDGFSPRQIRLKLTVDGKHLEQLYDWKVGKVMNSSPKLGDNVSQKPIGRN